jgi:hypothetical protein
MASLATIIDQNGIDHPVSAGPSHDRPVSGGYRVDISRGRNVSRVSSEWFSRPDDERFLSLTELHDSVRRRADRATTRTVESRAVRVEARSDNPERLSLLVPGDDRPVAPTNWSFGQLASLVGAPASYLRTLPAALAGINMQHGLLSHRAEQVKLFQTDDGRTELRAVTGPDYGRIFDHELVSAVMRIAGNGIGDTRWKVPGVLDWGSMVYNPHVDVSMETTTLYASDRDIFLFLVDDTHPIEAGKLPNGEPDLYFRGFYAWNSEVTGKCYLLPARGVYEQAAVGRRKFRGDQYPPLEIRGQPLRARGRARARTFCRLLAAQLRRWHQAGARADRRPQG